MGAGLSGCTVDPAAPLIPLPSRPATVLPADAPTQTADGFPNILADPANVPGLPREPRGVEETKAAVASRGVSSQARTAAIDRRSFAAGMKAQADRRAEDIRRRIAASSRAVGEAPEASDPQAVRDRIASGSTRPEPPPARPGASPAPQADPGRPIDPDEVPPRAVGPSSN